MKIPKSKKLLLILASVIILLLILVFFVKDVLAPAHSVRVLDYGYSICTQDIPSSSCSLYEVTVESKDGKKSTYKVVGFSNRQSEKYDELTKKISEAKKQNVYITVKVNSKSEIVSIGRN